ncbi:hypothetical protein BU14_0076s0018 [Porphyra umbilicalis]|uniref:UNC-50 family protein n=1 Tax=Porphyra umbilicalis TaxID=2786 RepID=A0A1X6PF27_PORUM|nr:hypothetical protein BU14_0076s0018 [Porphyra umbilicalis]|eukprot:OSX79462.1 hypothetical protein BU14_0076s0018 [Porphyra umbilicalis]
MAGRVPPFGATSPSRSDTVSISLGAPSPSTGSRPPTSFSSSSLGIVPSGTSPLSGLGLGRTRSSRLPEYVRRLGSYAAMDTDFALWQMVHLVWAPSRVWRMAKFHRQTKGQWARDDPAFVAILLYFMTVTAIAHALAFHLTGTRFLSLALTFPLLHLLATGAVIATATTHYLRATLPPPPAHSHTPVLTPVDIEWLYAFDVHCNAFFPAFLAVYVVQYFLLPLFLGGASGGAAAATTGGSLIRWAGNSLWLGAWGAYVYGTFLGWEAVGVERATDFLWGGVLGGALWLLGGVLGLDAVRMWSRWVMGV